MKKNECGVSQGIRHLLNKYLLITGMILVITFGFFIPVFANGYEENTRSNNSGDRFRENTAIDITGKVMNNNGESLSGVTVVEKGTTNGTTTDASGSFSINVSSTDAVLVFSYVGFKNTEVAVNNTAALQNVVLMPDVSSLTDIVVIGYGTAKKSDLTGSVAVVKAEQLMDRPVPNVTQALQGKVAGVDVSVNSNAPGAGAKVRIRGLGSIKSSLDPV